MGILRKVQAWRAGRQPAFDNAVIPASIEARLGAAEYEFHQISRDVYAVLMEPRARDTPARQPASR